MEELIKRFNEESAAFISDATLQATRGNKAAGIRARKLALSMMGQLKEFRRQSAELAKK